jgi:hypothetical protein
MKPHAGRSVIRLGLILALSLSALAGTGCSGESGLSTSNDELGNIPQWAAQMMQKMPSGISNAVFVDVEGESKNPASQDYHDYWNGFFEAYPDINEIANFNLLKYWG